MSSSLTTKKPSDAVDREAEASGSLQVGKPFPLKLGYI